jgi:acetyl esterase/lipase
MGQKIPISATSAPLDATDTTVLDVSGDPQMLVEKGKVSLIRDVTYATRATSRGKPGPLRLDIQSPLEPGRYPLVVYITGGGFVVAPRQSSLAQRTYVANRGFVVASIQYRTVRDGATYRDGIADVKAAIRFLRANAESYRIDPSRVGVWGESAGGYLALMAGVTNGNSEYDQGDTSGVSADVTAAIVKFGGSDLSQLATGLDAPTVAANTAAGNSTAKYLFGPATQKSVLDDPAAVAEANPITHIDDAAGAFLFMHGIDDRIISPIQTQLPHQALLKKKARSTRYLLEGAGHGDLSVATREVAAWTTTKVMTLLVDFLDKELKG